MVSANTFGVNAFKCKNLEYTVDELVTAGVRLTKEAIAEVKKENTAEADRPMFSALDIGSIGKLLNRLGKYPLTKHTRHSGKSLLREIRQGLT